MQQGVQLKVDHVIGPYGPLSAANLPPSATKRWNVRRKAEVVAAVRGRLLSFEEARSRYAITPEEIRSWQRCIDQLGLKGLRAVHTQSGRADNSGRHIPEQCKAPPNPASEPVIL